VTLFPVGHLTFRYHIFLPVCFDPSRSLFWFFYSSRRSHGYGFAKMLDSYSLFPGWRSPFPPIYFPMVFSSWLIRGSPPTHGLSFDERNKPPLPAGFSFVFHSRQRPALHAMPLAFMVRGSTPPPLGLGKQLCGPPAPVQFGLHVKAEVGLSDVVLLVFFCRPRPLETSLDVTVGSLCVLLKQTDLFFLPGISGGL